MWLVTKIQLDLHKEGEIRWILWDRERVGMATEDGR